MALYVDGNDIVGANIITPDTQYQTYTQVELEPTLGIRYTQGTDEYIGSTDILISKTRSLIQDIQPAKIKRLNSSTYSVYRDYSVINYALDTSVATTQYAVNSVLTRQEYTYPDNLLQTLTYISFIGWTYNALTNTYTSPVITLNTNTKAVTITSTNTTSSINANGIPISGKTIITGNTITVIVVLPLLTTFTNLTISAYGGGLQDQSQTILSTTQLPNVTVLPAQLDYVIPTNIPSTANDLVVTNAPVGTVNLGDNVNGAVPLGDAASKNTGTTIGTVAAGDDSRIVNATPLIQFNTYALATVGVIGLSPRLVYVVADETASGHPRLYFWNQSVLTTIITL